MPWVPPCRPRLLFASKSNAPLNVADPQRLITLMPGLLILCFIAAFILFKIPTMTASLISGHIGGHGFGAGGVLTAAILRAF